MAAWGVGLKTMSSNGPSSSVDVAQLAGPLVIGNIALFVLFSLLSVQTVLYYHTFTRDKLLTKLLVFLVYSLLFVQAVLAGRATFYRDVHVKLDNELGWFYVPTVGGIVSFVVQNFYVWRIYMLSSSWIGAILISLASLASSITAFVSAFYGSRAGDPIKRLSSSKDDALMMDRVIGVSYSCSVICDVTIAIYMTFLLTRNGKIIHKNLRYLVRRFLLLTIETNFITTAVASITLAMLFGFPGTTYFATSSLLLPSFYANTFLMMLNSRMTIVHIRDAQEDPSLASLSSLDVILHLPRASGRGTAPDVKVAVHSPFTVLGPLR